MNDWIVKLPGKLGVMLIMARTFQHAYDYAKMEAHTLGLKVDILPHMISESPQNFKNPVLYFMPTPEGGCALYRPPPLPRVIP